MWGPRAQNPWLALVLDGVSAQLGTPIRPPGAPGPFALGDPSRLHTLLTGAGFVDVAVEPVPTLLRAPSSARRPWPTPADRRDRRPRHARR